MKKILGIITLFICANLCAQNKYKADWASLDARPAPQWYNDAKFGIFIHWGPYSVPAYAKKGNYSEWYWQILVDSTRTSAGHKEVRDYHNRVFGKDFTYPDFIKLFKCQIFNPVLWAKTLKRSGAKYVVLTSKHHDGYCLWDNKEADQSWGRPWNSTNSGPMRDLLGELTKAVRNEGIKMGIYYSLYEWFNPIYRSNVHQFVEKHLFPQFKDVVNKYSPSIIFSDGEWNYPDSIWRSPELLAWLYNESPSKDDVIVNDRWGSNTRHKHGGYYTTEYGSGLSNDKKAWEESRGMGSPYGYNINEDIEDYNSSQQLIYMLIDIVSRGGNFLLDIGPTADGRIPVIMQERLADIGKWLDVNGEAIYGTRCGTNTCQWSKGKIADAARGTFRIKYDIMKLTVSPDAGMAVKEVFFTRKKNNLYCICPLYPKKELNIKGVNLKTNGKVTMLGHKEDLKWRNKGKDLEIEVPILTASELPCQYAWTFKLSGIES